MNIKDDRGSATLWFVYFIPVLLVILVLAFDLSKVYVAKVALKQSAALAARSAAFELDEEYLKGRIEYDPFGNPIYYPPEIVITDQAEVTFSDIFNQNASRYSGILTNYHVDYSDGITVVNQNAERASFYRTDITPVEKEKNGYRVQLNQPGVISVVTADVELSLIARLALGKSKINISTITAAAPEMKE